MNSEVMTLTQFAKHIGITQQRASQYKAKGRLDGCFKMKGRTVLVNVPAAIAKLKETLDPSQKQKANIPDADKIKTIEDAGLDLSQCNYQNSRALNEHYKAALKKVEYEIKVGTLLHKDEVEKEAFNCARTVRDSILNIPNRIGDKLAVTTEKDKVVEILRTELTNALEALSK